MNRAILLAMTMTAILGLAGCEQKGPAEKLGESIDEAVGDIGNEVEDACEKVKKEAGAKDTDC